MVSDALVRYEARRLGWTGALRAVLTPLTSGRRRGTGAASVADERRGAPPGL